MSTIKLSLHVDLFSVDIWVWYFYLCECLLLIVNTSAIKWGWIGLWITHSQTRFQIFHRHNNNVIYYRQSSSCSLVKSFCLQFRVPFRVLSVREKVFIATPVSEEITEYSMIFLRSKPNKHHLYPVCLTHSAVSRQPHATGPQCLLVVNCCFCPVLLLLLLLFWFFLLDIKSLTTVTLPKWNISIG